MPENYGQIKGVEVVEPCELDPTKEYILVRMYDQDNCHWIYKLVER